MIKQAEYIWLDGTCPTSQLRSKTRIIQLDPDNQVDLNNFPVWAFDGSSTSQSSGENSDLILKPVRFINDPIRGEGNYLVMTEVFNADGSPHETNTRAKLRAALAAGGMDHNMSAMLAELRSLNRAQAEQSRALRDLAEKTGKMQINMDGKKVGEAVSSTVIKKINRRGA